jgi:hypothetical protein
LTALLGTDVFAGSSVAQATASPGQSDESVRITRIAADLLVNPALNPQQRVALVDALASFPPRRSGR